MVLQYCGHNKLTVSLRVDFPLYLTLQRLNRGLPRKLLPERDIFRLDAFLENLHPVACHEERYILSALLDRRELLEIEINADGSQYENISKCR